MGLMNGIWLMLLGVLAAPSLILSKRPDAAQALAKIAPYQGWIGAVSALWGVWGVIWSVLNIKWVSIFWATILAASLVQAALGLLLGVGVFKTFIKDERALVKMDDTIARLAPKQGQLGLVAIGLGLWVIIASFMFKLA